jgi:hypothetical protein
MSEILYKTLVESECIQSFPPDLVSLVAKYVTARYAPVRLGGLLPLGSRPGRCDRVVMWSAGTDDRKEEWTLLHARLPFWRTEGAAARTADGSVILTGGTAGATRWDEAHGDHLRTLRFDPASQTWHDLAPAPAMRSEHVSTVVTTSDDTEDVYVIGGNMTQDGAIRNPFSVTRIVANTMRLTLKRGSTPLRVPTPVIDFVDPLDSLPGHDNVNGSNVACWHAVAPMRYARANAACVGIGRQIFVFGGTGYDTMEPTEPTGASTTWSTFWPRRSGSQEVALRSCEKFDCATRAWSDIAPLPASRTDCAAVALPDGTIAVMGGIVHSDDTGERRLNVVDVYCPVTNAWTEAKWRLPEARRLFSAHLVDSERRVKLVVSGGTFGVPSERKFLGTRVLDLQTLVWSDNIVSHQCLANAAFA